MLTCNLPRFTFCLIQAKYKALTGQDPPAAGAKPSAKAEPAKVEAPKAVDAPKATAAPAASAPAAAAPVSGVTAEAFAVWEKISKQGDAVRSLKAAKAAKPEIDAAVKSLLELKVSTALVVKYFLILLSGVCVGSIQDSDRPRCSCHRPCRCHGCSSSLTRPCSHYSCRSCFRKHNLC